MTPEEAMEWFKNDLKDGKSFDDCPQCNASEIAVKALEKQIPLIPEEIRQSGFLSCPSCFRAIKKRIEESPHDINFCPFCGQALDWGE